MKAITLTQPWATLVAIGAKRIETRSWSTTYRGPLALHAAAGLGPIGGKRGLLETIALSNHFKEAGLWRYHTSGDPLTTQSSTRSPEPGPAKRVR